MNEWLKKLISQISMLWGKWTIVQKLILVGIIAAAIIGIVVVFSVSSAPTMVPLLYSPIVYEPLRDKIKVRLN